MYLKLSEKRRTIVTQRLIKWIFLQSELIIIIKNHIKFRHFTLQSLSYLLPLSSKT